MPKRLAERIWTLAQVIFKTGGYGFVTPVIENGRIARIVWSVDEKVQ